MQLFRRVLALSTVCLILGGCHDDKPQPPAPTATLTPHVAAVTTQTASVRPTSASPLKEQFQAVSPILPKPEGAPPELSASSYLGMNARANGANAMSNPRNTIRTPLIPQIPVTSQGGISMNGASGFGAPVFGAVGGSSGGGSGVSLSAGGSLSASAGAGTTTGVTNPPAAKNTAGQQSDVTAVVPVAPAPASVICPLSQQLVNGLCVTIPASGTASAPTTAPKIPTQPPVVQPPAGTTPKPVTCTSPQVLTNGQCVTPTPAPTPAPAPTPTPTPSSPASSPAPAPVTCTSPQVLIGGQCVTPTPTPTPSAPASSPTPAPTPANTLCQAAPNQSVPLLDLNGNPLPIGNTLNCNSAGQPASVTAASTTFALTPFGGSGGPAYGGIGPLCQLMLPDATSCYSSNPANQPLDETYACGSGVESTNSGYIVACNSKRCTAEIFAPGCAAAYPDPTPNATYSNTGLPLTTLVSGSSYLSAEMSYQDFANAQYDYTVSLNTARNIVKNGHTPLLDIQMVMFDQNGYLLPNAADNLANAIRQYPDVFNAPGLMIEVYDEPFWNTGNPSSGAQLDQQVSSIKQAIQILRSQLPRAILGLTQAGVWPSTPALQQGFAQVAPLVDVLITDVYAFSFDPSEWQYDFQSAMQFAIQQHQSNPGKPLMLVVQGFSPSGSPQSPLPTASEMSSDQLRAFELYMTEMFGISKSLYNSVMVWGWGFSNELSAAYNGQFFPPSLKSFYQSQTSGYTTLQNASVSSTPTLPLTGQWTAIGNASPEKIIFFSGPQNMNGYCDITVSGSAAPFPFSGSCWTWAGQTFSASGQINADNSVTATWSRLPGGHTATLIGALDSIGADGTFSVQ